MNASGVNGVREFVHKLLLRAIQEVAMLDYTLVSVGAQQLQGCPKTIRHILVTVHVLCYEAIP